MSFSEAIFDAGRAFLAELAALPAEYDGPDGLQREPYGLVGYGEAAALARVLSSWVDAPLVTSGTQFILAGGFDFGDAGVLTLSSELTEATVITLGHELPAPDWRVPPGALSSYRYAAYLAHATGHREAFAAACRVMQELAARLGPEHATEHNPAKQLAWALWNRLPLLVTSRASAGLDELVQQVFAQVGKALAVTLGAHPLAVASGAFEGGRQLGDDAVVVVLEQDAEVALAVEVLASRTAQIERLAALWGELALPEDPGARALVYWYASLWVAAYLALLYRLDPADTAVYEAVRAALHEPSSAGQSG